MLNRYFIVIIISLFFMPAFLTDCRAGFFFESEEFPEFIVSSDTIYQFDTVYQHEIIYDTLYYYDTIPLVDSLLTVDTLLEYNDSSVILNQIVNLKIKQNKTVYASKKSTAAKDNLTREFREISQEKTVPDILETTLPTTNSGENRISTITQSKEGAALEGIFTYQLRDTLYRMDTVISYETRVDTLFFESKNRSDTTISNQVDFQKYGKSVLVKNVVNVKVVHKESLFVESPENNTNIKHPNKNKKGKDGAHASSYNNNRRYKKDVRRSSRVNSRDNVSYTSYLKANVSLFAPDINFVAVHPDNNEDVHLLNRNSNPETSYAASFTYNYFQNKWGLETGLGMSRYKYNALFGYQELLQDTSYFWEYFQKEDFHYDTTWYINLDSLLQTGDTVLIPNVDSTQIWVSDSTRKSTIDSVFVDRLGNYNYSFTFLEIPIIGQYALIERKVFLRLALGLIPSFLISKSGDVSYSNNEVAVSAKDISFDYGFSLSAYGSFVLGYHVTDMWSVFVEPHIKQNVYSAIRNDQLKLRPNSWGVQFGLAYRLFTFKN